MMPCSIVLRTRAMVLSLFTPFGAFECCVNKSASTCVVCLARALALGLGLLLLLLVLLFTLALALALALACYCFTFVC